VVQILPSAYAARVSRAAAESDSGPGRSAAQGTNSVVYPETFNHQKAQGLVEGS